MKPEHTGIGRDCRFVNCAKLDSLSPTKIMNTIRLMLLGVTVIALSGCATAPKKPAEEAAKTEPLPAVDPFAPVTSGTAKYWEKRNAEDAAADEKDRAEQQRRDSK